MLEGNRAKLSVGNPSWVPFLTPEILGDTIKYGCPNIFTASAIRPSEIPARISVEEIAECFAFSDLTATI